MATQVQRAIAILEACLNDTPDAAILTKIGDAYAFTYRRGETLTNAEKALLLVSTTRAHIKQITRDAIRSQAAATAADAADSEVEIGSDA